MNKSGVTLLEVVVSIAILTVVTGALYMVALSLQNTSSIQEARVATQDQVRDAMLRITRDVRGAASGSINNAQLPGATLQYRTAVDNDGNGTAVNVGGFIELSGLRTISRNPANQNQVIMTLPDGTVNVLANGIPLNEDANNNGVLDGGEDTNANGQLERGLWFENVNGAIRITLQAQRTGGSPPRTIVSGLIETVEPRN